MKNNHIGGEVVAVKQERKITVIKGPMFDKVLQNAFVYTNQLIRRKLDEDGLEKIQQYKNKVVNG